VHLQNCIGIDNPNTADSDYEYWQPHDRSNDDCLLGRITTYTRRKQVVNCTNPDSINHKTGVIQSNCTCKLSDYECDFCFIKGNDTDRCIPDPECTDYDPHKPPEDCKDIYYASRGYRLIPGDSCNDTNNYNSRLGPEKISCPVNSNPFYLLETITPTWVILFLVFLSIGLLVGGVWYYSGRNPILYEFLSKYIPEKISSIRSKCHQLTVLRCPQSF